MIRNGRGMVVGTAIFAGCCLALSPAVGRVETVLGEHPSTVSLSALGSIGSFTPVTNDKRLAAAYAQAVSSVRNQGFRFTPTVGSMSGRRSITIVVRAPDIGLITASRSNALGIGPVAYNLGSARGLSRFATEISGSHISADSEPLISASALALPKGFKLDSSAPKRLTTSMTLENITPSNTAPQTLASEKSYAVDLGSSYKLTRNLNVTAGVRYNGHQNNRLVPLTDDAQDSQAVYFGTTFKF